MKKHLLFFILFCYYFSINAQEDAWVYLIDKQNVEASIANPISILTQKSIDRKAKHGVVIDARDVPVNEAYITQLKNATGITVLAKSKWFNAVHIRGEKTDIDNLLTSPSIAFIENIDFANKSLNTSKIFKKENKINKLGKENTLVDFTYGDTQNQVEMIYVNDLHIADYTGEGVTIAVLDASFTNVNTMGAFQRIRDAGDLLGGYDFVDRTNDVYAHDPRPTSISHGTQVLSTMAGYILNDYVGTAPDASYYLFRTEDDASENPVEESYWVEAAERADSLGVDIINTSLGYSTFDNSNYDYSPADKDGNTAFITKGANIAFEKGIMLVTSAGNSGTLGVDSPADSQYVLSIGAVDFSGNYVSFSSIGSANQPSQKPDVVAQGRLPYMVDADNNIVQNNGTSFSSPIMAGGIACLMQALPNKTNAEIMQLVRESASQYNTPDYELGYGIPNLQSALGAALSNQDSNHQMADVKLFPIPSKDVIFVTLPKNERELLIRVFNVIGKEVIRFSAYQNKNSINISSLSKGLYIATIESSKSSKTIKFIKN